MPFGSALLTSWFSSPEEGFVSSQASLPATQPLVGFSFRRRGNRLVVHRVAPNLPAHKAGLLQGDVLLQVGDTPCGWRTYDVFRGLADGARADAPLLIRVRRKANDTILDLTLVPLART